jgi:hypothetical protein
MTKEFMDREANHGLSFAGTGVFARFPHFLSQWCGDYGQKSLAAGHFRKSRAGTGFDRTKP